MDPILPPRMYARLEVPKTAVLRAVSSAAMLVAFGFPCAAQPPGSKITEKPFIECDRAELVRAIPELAGIQFEPGDNRLDGLLHAAGEKLRTIFAKRVGISAAEKIHEMRFEDTMLETSRRESFRYVVRPIADGGPFEEFRADPSTGRPVQAAPQGNFLITGHFFRLLRYLVPEYREQSRFRYLGRWTAQGRDYVIVAFAQRSEGAKLESNIPLGGGRTALLQGIVWIDSATDGIARLRLDLLRRFEDLPFNTLTTDISLAPVNLPSVDGEFWLPLTVTVHAQYSGGEVHTVHRYTAYQLYGADDQTQKQARVPAAVVASADDAWELVDRGISLARENKAGEALSVLRQALRLNPDMPVGEYHLAVALRAAGDFAGAEAELREAVKHVPDSGPVHNFLGILMFQRGDVFGAVAEFRRSAELQPKDATAHFNLAQALEKAGDRAAALEQYRTASNLAPGNASFKERFEQLERAANVPPAPAANPTIKVEVRQVLVPVIVTDMEGHHITGLTQTDFRVFEDGVEQQISGFSVENAGAPVLPVPADGAPGTTAPEISPKRAPVRRTYLIVIDSLHSAFADLVHVREALSRLFRAEQAGDAQYIVVAVGRSTKMVQHPTTDPEAVLKAVASKDFEKLFLGSGQGSMQADLLDLRNALDEARTACDRQEPDCRSRKLSLPPRANQIASEDRAYTLGFLSQFRSLVEALARGTERRCIVLLSDGFQLVSGQEAYELLAAYFPDMTSFQLRAERVQDLEPILRLAANNNIPIYTIDSRGLYTSGFYDAANPGSVPAVMPAVVSVMNQNATAAGQALSEIAAATGGTAFENSNNILIGLERAFADGRQYYVLAYTPGSSHPDGKFHAISVRMRDGKMLVTAKRGYWASAN